MSETTVGENQGSRLSRMAVLAAVLSFLGGLSGFLVVWWAISNIYQRPVDLAGTPLGFLLNIGLISSLVAMVVGGVAEFRIRRSQGRLEGLGLANTGVALGCICLLFSIAIPNLLTGSMNCAACRTAADTKHAVTQAIKYAQDKGAYPTSLDVLRMAGYANVESKDTWGNDYVLSPVLTQGRTPKEGDNVYVFSRGPKGTGVYPEPFTSDTGEDGSVGYSSLDGEFRYSYAQVAPDRLNTNPERGTADGEKIIEGPGPKALKDHSQRRN